jgi:hypothetical protein
LYHKGRFEFFRKFAEIFAAGVVFATGGVDTGGKFATGVVDTGGKFTSIVVDTGGVP